MTRNSRYAKMWEAFYRRTRSRRLAQLMGDLIFVLGGVSLLFTILLVLGALK